MNEKHFKRIGEISRDIFTSMTELETWTRWLRHALHQTPEGEVIANIEQYDDRKNIVPACSKLVLEFTSAPTSDADLSFIRALLHLALLLELEEVVGPLATLAGRFHELPNLDTRVKQAVLLTLVDFKAVLSVEFWCALYEQDRVAFGGAALSGILAQDWQSGLELLRELLTAGLSEEAAVIVEQALDAELEAVHKAFDNAMRALRRATGKPVSSSSTIESMSASLRRMDLATAAAAAAAEISYRETSLRLDSSLPRRLFESRPDCGQFTRSELAEANTLLDIVEDELVALGLLPHTEREDPRAIVESDVPKHNVLYEDRAEKLAVFESVVAKARSLRRIFRITEEGGPS